MMGVVGLLSLTAGLVLVHMHDRPDLDSWFNSLAAQNGMPCCSHVDGTTIEPQDWDTAVVEGKTHYRVRIDGQWIVVTDWEVVQGPNKYGKAIAWVYHADGKPMVRCFMPGTEG